MRKYSFLLLTLALVACSQTITGTVLRAVDGDTLKVATADGTVETIRIIGINTPETVDPRKPVQCFGPEASRRMHELADGKTVTLDVSGGDDRDRYHRMLRYVALDGRDLGAQMIEEGFARNYPIFPHPRMAAYKQLQTAAKDAKRGLWEKCVKK